jgi:hypothetical protein
MLINEKYHARLSFGQILPHTLLILAEKFNCCLLQDMSHATALAVGRWFLTMETQLQNQSSTFGICGE